MEVIPGNHKIGGVNANAYLVLDREELTLIDTRMPRNVERILDYVDKMNREPSEITTIVLTDCHIDHAGSVSLYDSARKAIFVGDTTGFTNGKITSAPKQFTLRIKKPCN